VTLLPSLSRLMLAAALATGGLLEAQSYQSSFSEVKFDRAKGPATLNAGVQVDAASGAASMEIPFGPGIGERGLRFRPTLSMRFAPQLGISSSQDRVLAGISDEGVENWQTDYIDTLFQRGYGSCSLFPGTLDLPLWGDMEDQTAYSFPGGGGSALGVVPPKMDPVAAENLLRVFDVTGSIAPLQGSQGQVRGPFIQMGSSGHLILGLKQGSDAVHDYTFFAMGGTSEQNEWPRRFLVVQGEIAYEYTYVSHSYRKEWRPYVYTPDRTPIHSAHFVLTRISNRFKEHIDFTYERNGVGFTATWSTNPNVKVRVAVGATLPGPQPGVPCLNNSSITIPNNINSLLQIHVNYEGITPSVGGYVLDVASASRPYAPLLDTQGGPGSQVSSGPRGWRLVNGSWGTATLNLQPIKILQEATGETIQFSYAHGPSTTWSNLTRNPTVLSTICYPNRGISLTWAPYRYRPNYGPNAWGPMQSPPRRPAWAYGVVALADADSASNQVRSTTYSRVTPQLNWASKPLIPGDSVIESWVQRDFYTAITHPDGQVSLHRFVEPSVIVNAVTGDEGMRNLAYLKHIERETRYYAAGVSWSGDLATTDPATSSAYKWVVKDRLDLRSIGNLAGSYDQACLPYTTRARSWDQESKVFTAEEMTGWKDADFAWTTTHRSKGLSSPGMAFDVRSLALVGQPYNLASLASGAEEQTLRSMDPVVPQWLFKRVATEASSCSLDATGFGSTEGGNPPIATVQDPTYNTVQQVTLGDANLSVTTSLDYQGTSGLGAAQLASATLAGSQGGVALAQSGKVGVSAYGYDPNGFLESIQTKPNEAITLTSQQTQDEIGRPSAQIDPNGRTTRYEWDGAGRLVGLVPPGGDESTRVAYHPDFRGLTLTHGAQVQELRYNAFGELVLERRLAPGGTWSHRIHGFNSKGQATGETVWIPGRGDDHESSWTSPNLIGATGTRSTGIFTGTIWAYDTRSRISKGTDPNGVVTQTTYGAWSGGPQRTVTVAPGTPVARSTTFQHDAKGRLVRVVDALGQVTTYGYDAADRNTAVNQITPGQTQARTWNYNGLGWLTSLTQPESGTTAYSAFTVAGKPQTTSYSGRIVNVALDWTSRVTGITAADGSVNQTFTFDAAGALGQLATSTDGPVTATYGYDPASGRLAVLSTAVPVEGISRIFSQSYTYDSYGNRIAGNTGHGSWTQTYHAESGLPNVLTYGSLTVASTPWASYDSTSWAIKMITYGNQVRSQFAYDADQTRLANLVHYGLQGITLAQWSLQYDAVGNLVKEVDALTGKSDQYGYDALNRLVSGVIQSPTYGEQLLGFAYDAFGNRILGKTDGPASVPGTFNISFAPGNPALSQHNQLPAQMTNGAYTGALYSPQGNLTQIYQAPGDASKVVTLGYDALGRVTSVFSKSTGLTETYQYRADGLRVGIREFMNGTYRRTRIQVYNDARQLVGQYEKIAAGSLTWKRDILYLGTREAAEIDSVGMHVTQVDHLGSPRLVTDPAGQVESRQKYLPFGELLEQTGNFKSAKGYTNHEQTEASGLIYMQARFYVPWVGRFTSPDPARDQHFEDTQSWNIYSYVQNNPVMKTDPTGMQELPVRPDEVGKFSAPAMTATIGGANEQLLNSNTAMVEEVKGKKLQTEQLATKDAMTAEEKPPYDTTKNVPTPLPEGVDNMLRKMALNLDEKLTVTATTNGVHTEGSAHYDGQAVDLRYPNKPKAVLKAAAESGAKFGLDEKKHPSAKSSGPHIHLQLRPGRGGARGDLPKPGGGGSPTPRPARPALLPNYIPSCGAFPLGSWS